MENSKKSPHEIEDTNQSDILIGLLSDTHVPTKNSSIDEKVLEIFQRKGIDYLVHCGDFVSQNAYDQLKSLVPSERFIAVRGNMDYADLFLQQLPETRSFSILRQNIFLTHGSGAPFGIIKRLHQNFDLTPYNIVFFGHTHQAMDKEKDGKYYINPGRCKPGGTIALVKITTKDVSVEIVRV